jgi:ribonuclease R
MDRLGQHCSMTEKRADDATRDAIAWLKCEFMLDKIGEEFDGVITGVTGFGLFVQLQDVFVEGLVHVTSLENDYYELDAPSHRLVGARSKKVYQLAAPLRVRVVQVDMEQRRIDFEPVEPDKKTRRRRRATRRKERRA